MTLTCTQFNADGVSVLVGRDRMGTEGHERENRKVLVLPTYPKNGCLTTFNKLVMYNPITVHFKVVTVQHRVFFNQQFSARHNDTTNPTPSEFTWKERTGVCACAGAARGHARRNTLPRRFRAACAGRTVQVVSTMNV